MNPHVATVRMGAGTSHSDRRRRVGARQGGRQHGRANAVRRRRDWLDAVLAAMETLWQAVRKRWKTMRAPYRHTAVWNTAPLVLECLALGACYSVNRRGEGEMVSRDFLPHR
jgi:hypothetical protein